MWKMQRMRLTLLNARGPEAALPPLRFQFPKNNEDKRKGQNVRALEHLMKNSGAVAVKTT